MKWVVPNFTPKLAISNEDWTLCFLDIPALSAPVVEETFSPDSEDADMEDESAESQQKFSRTSGPKAKDPYASDDSWFMPITIAVAVFLPVLFCLCRVR